MKGAKSCGAKGAQALSQLLLCNAPTLENQGDVKGKAAVLTKLSTSISEITRTNTYVETSAILVEIKSKL